MSVYGRSLDLIWKGVFHSVWPKLKDVWIFCFTNENLSLIKIGNEGCYVHKGHFSSEPERYGHFVLKTQTHQINVHGQLRRRKEFYYFDFGWGTLIHFPASAYKFLIFPVHFSNFGEGTFPLFPHPGGAMMDTTAIQNLRILSSLIIHILMIQAFLCFNYLLCRHSGRFSNFQIKL